MADDLDALREIRRAGASVGPQTLVHFLYFPREHDAASSAAELRAAGFRTEERLGADDVNWLVLARHEIVLTEATIAAARRLMEAQARRHGGEYDGWEAEVSGPADDT